MMPCHCFLCCFFACWSLSLRLKYWLSRALASRELRVLILWVAGLREVPLLLLARASDILSCSAARLAGPRAARAGVRETRGARRPAGSRRRKAFAPPPRTEARGAPGPRGGPRRRAVPPTPVERRSDGSGRTATEAGRLVDAARWVPLLPLCACSGRALALPSSFAHSTAGLRRRSGRYVEDDESRLPLFRATPASRGASTRTPLLVT